MKKLLLTALLCFCVNAYAFNWEKVFENRSGVSFYVDVDVDNIKKRDGFVYYWQLNDFLEPITGSLGIVNSVIEKYKVNCVEEKQTLLNGTFYSQSMGRGKIIDEDSPNKIKYPRVPKVLEYAAMKFVCDNAK